MKPVLASLGIGLFTGIVIISIGIGAVLTPLQSISAPLVCGGQAELETQHYSYKPGQSGYTITWYCVDRETGARVDKTFPLILASGVIYGLALGLILLAWVLLGRPVSILAGMTGSSSPGRRAGSGSARDRLAKLKSLRDSGLITEAEYAAKKAEILEEI